MIGILTFINTLNYGALLQEYALYTIIRDEISNVEVINYYNHAINKRECPCSITDVPGVKGKIKYVLLKNSKKEKKILFDEFTSKYIKYSEFIGEKDFEKINKYSKIIVGSDQVWNLNLTSGDFNFYLNGIDNEKKFSYAASFGYSRFKEDKEQCIDLLSKFNNLYVREIEAVRMLNNEKLNAECVLDPTFLLSKDSWINNLNLIEKTTEKYILLYFLKNDKVSLPIIMKYARLNNLKIKYINITPKTVLGVEDVKNCSPTEFLNLILNAEIIFTGSYHGLALSLIFNKKIYYILDKNINNYNSRINTLISLFAIEKNELTIKNLENEEELNYKKINEIIKIERAKSLDMLRGLLDEK